MSDFLDMLIPARNPRSVVIVAAMLLGGPVWGTIAAMGINSAFGAHDRANAQRRARAKYNASLTDRGVMIRSGLAPRQAVVGRAKVSGPIIYATSSGAKKEYLHLVICLAAHEVDAIETIYFNDVELPAPDGSGFVNSGQFVKGESEDHTVTKTSSTGSFTLSEAPASIESITYADGSADDGVSAVPPANITLSGVTVTISSPPSGSVTYTVNYTTKTGTPLVRIKKFLGVAAGQRDTALETESGGEWTASHHGKGIARLHLRIEYDQDVFGSVGLPNVSAVVRGAKVRDSRAGTTVWSQNSALITAWWLKQQELGLRQAAGTVLDAELSPQANICDEDVAIDGAGATQKRYTTNGVIYSDTPLRENLETLLAPMAGTAVFVQGRWTIKAGAYEAPTLFLTESDFAPGAMETVPYAPYRELFNAVTSTYVDAASGYIERQAPIVENATYVAWDGGEQITTDIQMPMVDDAIRAQRLAKIALEQGRQALTFSATFKSTAYDCKPGDIIGLTIASDGWAAKPFLVVERTYDRQQADRIRLLLRETAAGVWNWAHGEATSVDLAPNTSLPSPGIRPAALTGLSAATGAAYVVKMPDGSEIVRAFLQWTAANNIWVLQGGRIEIQHKRDDATSWTDDPPVSGSATSGYAAPIDRQRATLVRVRPVNVLGLAGDWTTYLINSITGDNTPPGDVTGLWATVAGANVTFFFAADPAPDHASTELRRGSWSAPAETLIVTGSSATWTADLTGSYTWYARHRDRSGNYSTGLAAVTVNVTSASSSGPVDPLPLMAPWKTTAGGAPASVSADVRRNGSRSSGGPWYLGGSATVGDGYWARLTKTSGDSPTSGPSLGAWVQLNTDRIWSLGAISDNLEFVGTLDIASNSSGSVIVASGPVTMRVDSYSGSIP